MAACKHCSSPIDFSQGLQGYVCRFCEAYVCEQHVVWREWPASGVYGQAEQLPTCQDHQNEPWPTHCGLPMHYDYGGWVCTSSGCFVRLYTYDQY